MQFFKERDDSPLAVRATVRAVPFGQSGLFLIRWMQRSLNARMCQGASTVDRSCSWLIRVLEGGVVKRREPIVATVCVGDYGAEKINQNGWRLDLAKDVARKIEEQEWEHLDAVVFPGGFLRIRQHIRPYPPDTRISRVQASGIVKRLATCARMLTGSPGVKLVVGVDGRKYANGDAGDQLCVAVGEDGVEGIASKIFPVGKAKAGEEPESKKLVLEHADFGSKHRLISLPNGHRGLLCACYDMFGVAEQGRRPGARGKAIRRIAKADVEIEDRQELKAARQECLSRWKDLMQREAPSVALGAIHGFGGHSTAYWQKHGIASASAAMGKGYALGAAHFHNGLPKRAGSSTLAAAQVSKAHLKHGVDRRQNAWSPADSVRYKWYGVDVLIRLFDGNSV
jgi:hypothetical protein